MWTVYISVSLSTLVLALLVRNRYIRLVPWFASSLLTRIIPGVYLVSHWGDHNTYYQFWFVGEISLLVTLLLSAVELYFLITKPIYRLGWIGFMVFLLACSMAAAVAVSTGSGASAHWNVRVAVLLEAKRLLLTFLSVALGGVFLFYGRFAIPTASFVWPHGYVFLAYVASHAAGYWAIEASGGKHLDVLNQLLGVLWAACLVAWSWVFSQRPSWPQKPTDAELREADRRAEQLTRLVD